MQKNEYANVLAYGLLAAAGVGVFLMPATSPKLSSASPSPLATPPETVKIPGVVRDFLASHPDFNVTPVDGYGHYAGNVGLTIDGDWRPAFAPAAGYRVNDQWRNGRAEPIPPHFYMTDGSFGGPNEIYVANASDTPSGTGGVFDSWDSSVGPYGGSNVGPAPTVVEGSEMPIIKVPTWLSDLHNRGDLSYSRNATIASDLHCDTLHLDTGKTLTINGHVTILVNNNLHLHTSSQIVLAPNSSLTMYLRNGGESWNHVEVNANTGNPNLVTVYNLGSREFMIHNYAKVFAVIISPDAQINVNNHGEFYGRFIGERMEFGNHGDFHLDQGIWEGLDRCGRPIADLAGTIDKMSEGGVTSDLTFAEWYRDVPGVNASGSHVITLKRDHFGIYEFSDNTFYPADDRLLGNEGAAHNFNFTYSFAADFVFSACEDLFLEFEGQDDAWMYIGDALAMDLGGIKPGTSQYVEIDRLGLDDGETYTMRFFFAQRNGSSSVFKLRTNLLLQGMPDSNVMSGGYD